MLFEDLKLSAPVLRALTDAGYQTPTPIQEQAIPLVLDGRDLLGSAQTGTGKTAAFALPIVELLSEERHPGKRPIRALVLTPTRELAGQISDNFRMYAKYTGLRETVVYGGVSQFNQTRELGRGVDILIATPGRLLDLMNQGFVNLRNVEFLVLDEADRMLDMGFIHDIRKIMAQVPQDRQTLFFSATMPPNICALASDILSDPERVEVSPESSTVDTVEQKVYFVEKGNKKSLLLSLLEDPDMDSVLVFSRTKHGADRLAQILSRSGIKCDSIHGDKSQNARQRALDNFKSRRNRVLIATDIAARGIDVNNLSYVVNYDLPADSESYVHRIGRTGRAGREGISVSFCDESELGYLKDIKKLIGRSIEVVDDQPFHCPEYAFAAERASQAQQPKAASKGGNKAKRFFRRGFSGRKAV